MTTSAAAADVPSSPSVAPESERRHVSVLFVDLVGFTTLSESRDPEAVRELLSDYFEQARTIVDRYGGTIEKFIGDAVMAVWGTPVVLEDDAERAVRAGLELVDAVAVLGETALLDGLQARAGVVSGEVAVKLDAVGQGMVAGDVVNTAARLQSAADPGFLLVDEATWEASSRAISYVPAGEHQLKGKAEPVRLYRAAQVVAGTGGAMRFDGLEAVFMGRDRELRLVKELFHDSEEHSRARLVLVSGVAGVGKSRLAWEFFKYLDGISLESWWHIGRCLSYGEGVAYWALAETVRMRLRVLEGDSDDAVLAKLTSTLDERIGDESERRWLLPRLAVLLGIADQLEVQPGELERESLFAGWRVFFERFAEQGPVVLVLEDLQYADTGLLDFVDHLLDWSSDKPIFILGLARPELGQQRPELGSRRRNVTELYLEPVSDEVIGGMVDTLVEGLPVSTRTALAARAEGIPLFAIETIRMLIDRDVVIPRDGVYVLAADAGELRDLDVPQTLQALVAARLDNLPEDERRLVKDASVLGLSFTSDAAAHVVSVVGTLPVGAVEDLLSSLVRKEVLTLQADSRSPEAGQYRFVQKVMRAVAYETLSRRDRKARHLAVAAHLEGSGDVDDLAGVIATHYLQAADAVPEDPGADQLRAIAAGHLERAGDRARALAAPDEAQRYYVRALDLAAADPERARLAEQAGIVATLAADYDTALEHFATARALLEEAGDVRGAARLAAREGDVLIALDRHGEALERMHVAYEALAGAPHDLDMARLANTIASAHVTRGDLDAAAQWLEIAIEASEGAGAWDILARALNVKGMRLMQNGRHVEGTGLLRTSLALAREHGMTRRAGIQTGNLALLSLGHDLDLARELASESLEHAHKIGDRSAETLALAAAALVDFHRGHWDTVRQDDYLARMHLAVAGIERLPMALPVAAVAGWCGTDVITSAIELAPDDELGDVYARSAQLAIRALLAWAHERHDDGLAHSSAVLDLWVSNAFVSEEAPIAWPTAVDCALALGRVGEAQTLVAIVADGPPGLIPPLLRGELAWLQARVAAAAGSGPDPGELYTEAARILRDRGARPWLGRALLDHAEWLSGSDEARSAGLAREALEIFTELGAQPFAARAARLVPADEQLHEGALAE